MSPSTATSSSAGARRAAGRGPRRRRGAPRRRAGAASSSAAPHGKAAEGVAQIGHREDAPSTIRWPCPRAAARRLWWLVAGAVVALLLAGAAAAVVVMRSGEGDVSNPDVAFEDTTESVAVAPDPVESARRRRASRRAIPPTTASPGPCTATRSRGRTTCPVGATLRPPFREAWSVTGRVLLEFTPVLCGRRLFLLKNNGALYAISRLDGRVAWKRKLGSLAAASPACDGDTVYVTLLQRYPRLQGRAAWRRSTPSTGGPAGRASCRAARSPRRSSTPAACTSARRTARCTRCARPTARCAGG